jgi:hypothetical protein
LTALLDDIPAIPGRANPDLRWRGALEDIHLDAISYITRFRDDDVTPAEDGLPFRPSAAWTGTVVSGVTSPGRTMATGCYSINRVEVRSLSATHIGRG